jgi:hypothetical protein
MGIQLVYINVEYLNSSTIIQIGNTLYGLLLQEIKIVEGKNIFS